MDTVLHVDEEIFGQGCTDAHAHLDLRCSQMAYICFPGPSCSKLTMSLVNDSLKFTLSDTQIC